MSFPLKKHLLALSIGLAILPMLSACSDDDKDKKGSLRVERSVFNEGLSVVSQWNELALAGLRESGARPTVTTRQLFIFSSAMYDAWSAFDDLAIPYALDPAISADPAATEEDKARAVSQAAYQVLIKEFPSYEASTGHFAENMKRLGYPILTAGSTDTPDGIGFLAAEAAIAKRADDGSNAAANYADTTSAKYSTLYEARNSANPEAATGFDGESYQAGYWQPLRVPTGTVKDANGHPAVDATNPDSFKEQKFLTPHWGAVTPFALSSGKEVRPLAPPRIDDFSTYTDALGNESTSDAAFRAQFDQVLEFNGTLTDEQRAAAEFWADGPRTEAPPGHWNQLAHGVSGRDSHTVEQDVKMFFALNGALLDASIAAWDAKREFDLARPATAIPHMYRGKMVTAYVVGEGIQQIRGEDWRPYQAPTFVTPPFPEYVSGHSTFSSSAAQVLTRFTGAPTFYDGSTRTVQDINGDAKPDLLGQFIVRPNTFIYDSGPSQEVTLRWETFKEAADEASLSRLYGGIHIQDGDRRAREMGEKIGEKAFELAERFWSGDSTVRP